jgi:hypothetical protein
LGTGPTVRVCAARFVLTTKKPQIGRFHQTARDLGADESDDALDRIMGKLDLTKKPEPEPKPTKK